VSTPNSPHEQPYSTPISVVMSSAQSSIVPHSSSTWSHTTSDTVTLKGASPSIGKAATGSPLVRAILESYGKQILESASDQFLDLAVRVRLQTISERELVKLLAKAKRLGYQETDIIDDEDGVRPVQEANAGSRSKPNGIETPKPRATIAGQRRPFSTASTQPPSLEESRAPNRTNTAQVRRDESLSANAHLNAPNTQSAAPSEKAGGYSIRGIQGVAGMQDGASTAARTAGKHGERECSKTRSGARVAAHVASFSSTLKRTRAQEVRGGVQSRRPRKLVQTSAGKSSPSISAQPLEVVVISDSDLESEDGEDH
jgi:hypothetical protein